MTKKLKCWKKSSPRKDLIVFEKGKKIAGSKFNLRENALLIEKEYKPIFPDSNWSVRSNLRINPETVSGKYKFFKRKSDAMRFAFKVMKKHNKC